MNRGVVRVETYDPATGDWQTGPKTPLAAAWPDPPAPEAFYGLAGDVVRAIEPYSEADSAALLIQALAFFGNVIGLGPHFRLEADTHRTKLNAVLVGLTSKGRKGVSMNRVTEMFKTADPAWLETRVLGGLSSGEGLVWAVRDRILKRSPIKKQGRIVEYQEEEVDPGVADKRLLVIETEFSRVLKMTGRDGSVLSETVRRAWDDVNLRNMPKNSPAVATGAHISIVGHITNSELLRGLTETEQANGFGNRFLWVCVRRSKCLPDNKAYRVDPEVVRTLQERIRSAVDFARGVEEMERDGPAQVVWETLYKHLSEGKPGLLGAMTARAEPYVLRLSMVYALLDGSALIRLAHLRAAAAVWDYCEQSAKYIFGDALGDPTADAILSALRNSPAGLSRTEISNLFFRNKPAQEISRALGVLSSLGLASCRREEAEGRTIERWRAQ